MFVAANKRRIEAIRSSWEAWWPATALYVEGACVGELDNSQCIDDWPEHFALTLPGPGIWIWEGKLGWSYAVDDPDRVAEGAWRRPNAVEAWHLIRGNSPLEYKP